MSGVAVYPIQRWVHDHPNVHPMRTTWKFFRRYAFFTCFTSGYMLAEYMSNREIMSNEWYTRPDLKPKAAMVHENLDYD